MTRLSLALLKYEYSIRKLQDEVTYGFHMQDEILKLFPPVEVVHRGAHRIVSTPNILDRSSEPHKVKFNIDPDMFLQTDVVEFSNVLFRLTESLLDQLRAQTIGVMFDTGEAAGNSIDGKGRDVWELYIEALERMDYMFQGYKFFVGADVMKKMLDSFMTDEQLERAKAIVKAKREEFQAKKRSRRLS